MKDKTCYYTFTGLLKESLTDFISYKRSLGFKYGDSCCRVLKTIDDLSIQLDLSQPVLTEEIVKAFTVRREGKSVKTQMRRMVFIRQLALFMNRTGLRAYVLPYSKIRIPDDFVPYIFTREEIVRLTDSIDNIRFFANSPRCHIIYPMLFRILYGCGLRLSEALTLQLDDVNLKTGILHVHKAKNNTSRLIPMSASLWAYSKKYVTMMDFNIMHEGYFLPAPDNNCYSRSAVRGQFIQHLKRTGIQNEKGLFPRIHDLRHTFSVHSLEKMVQEGMDMNCVLPILSVYLGHCGIESTESYLRLTKESFEKVVNTVAPFYKGIFPEVANDE